MLRTIVALAAVAVLTSCASKPLVAVSKPTIKSIAIIPPSSPTSYVLENRSMLPAIVPVTHLAFMLDSREKAKRLTEKIGSPQFSLGTAFTNAIAEGLRGHGYTVQVLENLPRTPGDPDSVDYQTLQHTSDAALHVYFSSVGLVSPASSANYRPRVNMSGIVFVKGSPNYLYEEDVLYGVDAREGKKWAIVADEKLAFPDFEYVLDNLELVRGAFLTGAKAVAQRMADQIHAAVN